MVSAVLYHKNGVITEERFQKLTPIQWVYHYMEIMKFSGKDKKLFLEKLDDISLDVQAFYLLVDRERGLDLINSVSKAKKEARSETSKVVKKSDASVSSTDNEEEYPDLLSDEEKELWAFMEQQPKVIKETRDMKNVGRHILPKRSVKALKEAQQAKIIDSMKEIEKPKLGF